jgi:hypothetical protein
MGPEISRPVIMYTSTKVGDIGAVTKEESIDTI